MPKAVSTGTDVDKAGTMYELRHLKKILSAMDVVGGLTNQGSKYPGNYLSHSICDWSSDGHYRP